MKILGFFVVAASFLAAEPFKVQTTFPTEVTSTSTTLRGVVTSYGQATSCLFDVSTNGGPVLKTGAVLIPATVGVAMVAQSVTGLPTSASLTVTMECIAPGSGAYVPGQAYLFTLGGTGVPTATTPTPTFTSMNVVPMGNPRSPNAGISPYALISIFGSGLATQTLTAPSTGYPTALGGTTVTFNGIAGYLKSVSPWEIDVLTPPELPAIYSPITVQVAVDAGGGNILTTSASLQSQQTSPGIFGYQDSSGNDLSAGQVLRRSNSRWLVTIYGTGFGIATATNPGHPPLANPLSVLVFAPSVTFTPSDGRLMIQKVTWAGLAPGQIGVDQINAEISGDVALGQGTLTIMSYDGTTVRVPLTLGN